MEPSQVSFIDIRRPQYSNEITYLILFYYHLAVLNPVLTHISDYDIFTDVPVSQDAPSKED